MHRHAAQRIRPTVENETALGIHLDRAVADLCLCYVHHSFSLEKLHPQGVEVRILHSVPEVKAGKNELVVEVIFRESPYRHLTVSLIAKNAVRLKQLDTHQNACVLVAGVDEFRLDIRDHLLPGNLRNLAAEPVHAVILGRQIDIVHHQKPDRIMQTAVLIEI